MSDPVNAATYELRMPRDLHRELEGWHSRHEQAPEPKGESMRSERVGSQSEARRDDSLHCRYRNRVVDEHAAIRPAPFTAVDESVDLPVR